MALDPQRILSAEAAAAASISTSMVAQVSVWFGLPPPTRRQVLKGIVETVVGIPIAVLFGYGFGRPVAGILTAMVGWMTKDQVQVDQIAGALVVGTVVLRVVPLLGAIAEAQVRRRFIPSAQAARSAVAEQKPPRQEQ